MVAYSFNTARPNSNNMHFKRAYTLISLVLLSFSLTGFQWFYRPDIHQGNIITEKEIAQLRQGMTIREVKKIFGTPVLEQTALEELSTEHTKSSDGEEVAIENEEADIMRMEYVYFYQTESNKPTRKRISLFFEDEKLIKFKVFT
jgi:hypothetical protein